MVLPNCRNLSSSIIDPAKRKIREGGAHNEDWSQPARVGGRSDRTCVKPADARRVLQGQASNVARWINARGGYDTLARAAARHWTRTLPGAPNMIVQNMPAPAVSQWRATCTISPPRMVPLLALATTPCQPGLSSIRSAARFDPAKLSWIGGPSRDAQVVAVWHTSPVLTIEELFTKELIVGGDAVGSAPVDYPVAANVLLKTKFKVISDTRVMTRLTLRWSEVRSTGMLGSGVSGQGSQRG